MKQRKIPMRMCVGCRTMKQKRELVRVVKNASGEIALDLTGKASGRGAYICRDQACLNRAVKIRAFEHAFGQSIPEETLKTLAEELEQANE